MITECSLKQYPATIEDQDERAKVEAAIAMIKPTTPGIYASTNVEGSFRKQGVAHLIEDLREKALDVLDDGQSGSRANREHVHATGTSDYPNDLWLYEDPDD